MLNSCAVCAGVAQCSILGPILFAVYVTDVSLRLKQSSCDIFAGNGTVYTSNYTCVNADKLCK